MEQELFWYAFILLSLISKETTEERPDPVKNVQFMGAADVDHIGSLLATWRQKAVETFRSF